MSTVVPAPFVQQFHINIDLLRMDNLPTGHDITFPWAHTQLGELKTYLQTEKTWHKETPGSISVLNHQGQTKGINMRICVCRLNIGKNTKHSYWYTIFLHYLHMEGSLMILFAWIILWAYFSTPDFSSKAVLHHHSLKDTSSFIDVKSNISWLWRPTLLFHILPSLDISRQVLNQG